jgi:hypothetical protein
MKKQRFMTVLYFTVIVVFVPVLFILIRTMMNAFFDQVTWEDRTVIWLDQAFNLPSDLSPKDAQHLGDRIVAGGSRKWAIDISTLPFLAWLARFVSGSLEEIRYAHDLCPLKGIEIISRWLGVAVLLLLGAPTLAGTFYQILRLFQVWEPLVFLFAIMFFLFLCFWSWQYPDRRLKHVQMVYRFESLKR